MRWGGSCPECDRFLLTTPPTITTGIRLKTAIDCLYVYVHVLGTLKNSLLAKALPG